jgi:uncharacterized protein YtpQ (UPF0354 family)
LILDRGDSFSYVEIDAIPAWEVDSQTAYEQATENLERLSEGVEASVNGQGVETFLLDSSPHAAARVMLPSRLADWQARIEGELVLGVPTHDLLLGFSREHPAYAELREQIARDAQSAPNGVTGSLLLVREGGLELLA